MTSTTFTVYLDIDIFYRAKREAEKEKITMSGLFKKILKERYKIF
jgi:hypothetical protein